MPTAAQLERPLHLPFPFPPVFLSPLPPRTLTAVTGLPFYSGPPGRTAARTGRAHCALESNYREFIGHEEQKWEKRKEGGREGGRG